MFHSSNYRFTRGQNQPAQGSNSGVSNIKPGEQNRLVKDANLAHRAALENVKERIDFELLALFKVLQLFLVWICFIWS